MRRAPGLFAASALAAVAGGLQALSLAVPRAWGGQGEPLWWLQIAALAMLVALLQRTARMGHAALLGGVFGTAWLAGTFWWLFISKHTYAGLAAPLAVLGVLGLAAFLATNYALAAALYWRLAPAGGAPWRFAALWTLAELLRGWLWTGFPWGAGGYAHVDGPLAALAPWAGVYGMGGVAAWLAAALATLVQAQGLQRWRALALPMALLAWGALGTGAGFSQPQGPAPLSVALLQGNIPQDEKFQPGSGIPMALAWYGEALRAPSAALVVAPETAIPLLPRQLIPGYLEALQTHFSSGTQAGMVGIPLGDLQSGYTNSALGWAPGRAEPYRYDKHHLVPFGEFIPPFFKWFTAMMHIPLGDFARGTVAQPSLAWAGQRLAPNICYEDLFGEELGARFAAPGQEPTVFVNLSNIGWFGNSVAIDQHLHISRLRALEFERPMLRATNTGATVVIDHRGVVTHRLPPHERGILEAQVQGRTGLTPYARWVSRWGHAPLALVLVVALLAAAARRRRA